VSRVPRYHATHGYVIRTSASLVCVSNLRYIVLLQFIERSGRHGRGRTHPRARARDRTRVNARKAASIVAARPVSRARPFVHRTVDRQNVGGSERDRARRSLDRARPSASSLARAREPSHRRHDGDIEAFALLRSGQSLRQQARPDRATLNPRRAYGILWASRSIEHVSAATPFDIPPVTRRRSDCEAASPANRRCDARAVS
jgi:hypothetical protein